MALPPPEYNLKRDKLLPHVDGPKLWAFKYRQSPVKIVSLLSDPNSGGHGHVFDVLIRGRRYALKVFRFYDVLEDKTFKLQQRKVHTFIREYHSDPFFAECRAYGRIHEIQEKRWKRSPDSPDIAVPCYGFMAVPAIYEKEFQENYGITDWNRLPEDKERALEKRSSFRAIVKKLMPKGDAIQNPKKMANDFLLLRKSGIIQRDELNFSAEARPYLECWLDRIRNNILLRFRQIT